MLVELFPFGRAKFARELVPLLEQAKAAGRLHRLQPARHPRQHAARTSSAHDDRAAQLANAHLDAVLVHCDPRFARLEETFKPSTPLRVPVHYTGFVARNGDAPAQRGDHIVVSAGGGRVGAPLLEAAMNASHGRAMRAIAGPLMPRGRLRAAAAAPAGQRRARALRPGPRDASSERRKASISQCGYNTALDLLRTRVPALVVPYATPEEDEQTRRARRLEQLGAVQVTTHLNGNLDALLEFTPSTTTLDLDGAAKTRELLP